MHLGSSLCVMIPVPRLVSGKAHPAVPGYQLPGRTRHAVEKTSPPQGSPSWIKNKRKSPASAQTPRRWAWQRQTRQIWREGGAIFAAARVLKLFWRQNSGSQTRQKRQKDATQQRSPVGSWHVRSELLF